MMAKRNINPYLTVFSMFLCVILLSSFAFAGDAKYGGILKIGVRSPQYNRLDARYLTTVNQVPTAEMIYDRLFTWGEQGYGGLVPNIATGYETKDNKVWVIRLREGVKFHNGREMTAEDVKANFDWRLKTPKGWRPISGKELIKYLNRVEVIDKYTFKIILDKPFSPLIRVLAWSVRGILPPEEVEKWGSKFTLHPVGTGPFKVVEIKPKEKIVLERFDDYWGPKPYVDRVEVLFIRSDEARLIAMQKGELNVAQLYDEARPTLDKDPDIDYRVGPNIFTSHRHFFNFRRWPMNDIRFRRAMWMGADWKNIAIGSWPFNSGNYARTLFDHTKFFNPDALSLIPPYDPEKAKDLIKAVEKDAGKKIPPIYWLDANSTAPKNVATVAKIQLEQIGVPLNLQLLPYANWYVKGRRDPKIEWDTFGYGFGFGIDPSLGLRFFETNSGSASDGKSLGGYSNPEFDRWIAKAEAAIDEQERIKSYHEAEKVLLKDAVAILLWPWRAGFAWNKGVKDVKITNTMVFNVCNTWCNVWVDK
jgi:peptide/nickel transport system substrate-binding protein